MSATAYRVVAGDVHKDRDRILDLWIKCGFGTDRQSSADRYDWFYLGNPLGPGRVYLLYGDNDEMIVGAGGVGRRTFHITGQDEPLVAGLLVDFVVHPDHRTLFPAMLLQRKIRELEWQHVQLLYGFPDQKAVPVLRRLGSAVEISSATHVRVMRSANLIHRRLPWLPFFLVKMAAGVVDALRARTVRIELLSAGVVARTVSCASPEWMICQHALQQRHHSIMGERSVQTLDWRALAPGQGCEFVEFIDSQAGRSLGYVCCTLEERALLVRDILLPPEEGAARAMLLSLADFGYRRHVDTVRVDFGGLPWATALLLQAGYHVRDRRPGFLIPAQGLSTAVPNTGWFTRADEDV